MTFSKVDILSLESVFGHRLTQLRRKHNLHAGAKSILKKKGSAGSHKKRARTSPKKGNRVKFAPKLVSFVIYLRSILGYRKDWQCVGRCRSNDVSCMDDDECEEGPCVLPVRKQYLHYDFDTSHYYCKDTPATLKQGLEFIERIVHPGMEAMRLNEEELTLMKTLKQKYLQGDLEDDRDSRRHLEKLLGRHRRCKKIDEVVDTLQREMLFRRRNNE